MTTTRLTVLGSSGTYAGVDNACSGYLLRSGGVSVLIDSGPGTLANLQRHVAVTGVDAIVVTHAHPDHWGELPVLRNALRYVHGRSHVPLHTTVEVLDLLDAVTRGRVTPTFQPHVISDGAEFRIGPARFRCSRTDHPPETLAVRVDVDGSSLAYSADTGPGWSPAELGRDVGLFVCEATLLHGEKPAEPEPDPVHLTAQQAGSLARAAGARRLALTHLLPLLDPAAAVAEASDAYGAAVELAQVHSTFTC